MRANAFASAVEQPSVQNHPLSRRDFLLGTAALLTLGLPHEVQAAASFDPFTFAFISDVHLATGVGDTVALLQESQLFLQDVVKQLNALKPGFVIFGGDQVEGPGKDDVFWNLFIDVLQTLNSPWYFILGESDVSGRNPVDKMGEFGPDWKGRGLTSGKPYWSCDPVPGVHLVGLDTSKSNTASGDISNEQLNWLKSDLQANRGKFTFVASHHPLLAPPPYDGGPPWDEYMVAQGASAREILGGSRDVRLCLSGHVPVNKVQQEGTIWYVSCATLAIYPCQFKVFTVSPQAVQMETYQISYDALVKRARKILEGSRTAYQYSNSKPQTFLRVADGETLDRNALLPLVSGAVSPKEEKKKSKSHNKEKKEEKDEKKHGKESQSDQPEKGGNADKSGTGDKGDKVKDDKGAGDEKAGNKQSKETKVKDIPVDQGAGKANDKSNGSANDKSTGSSTDKSTTKSSDDKTQNSGTGNTAKPGTPAPVTPSPVPADTTGK